MTKEVYMAITDFGKAVRKARIEADVTLAAMAAELETTPSFLSALEMGRKKIPADWIGKIESYFARRGVLGVQLGKLADVANKSVSLEGLSPAQQMLVAGFARVNLDDDQLARLRELLGATTK
jgi:transcriptional regulator with XRE-family HTH domain